MTTCRSSVVDSDRLWTAQQVARKMDCGVKVEETFEFKLLQEYTRRRRPQNVKPEVVGNGKTGLDTKMMKKKHKVWKFFSCIHVKTKESEPSIQTSGHQEGVVEFQCLNGGDGALEVADRLTRIADSLPIGPGDIETDCLQDTDVIQQIVELLRESGDRLNEEVKNNESLARQFQNCFDYNFFERVTRAFLQTVGSFNGPHKEEAKIALAFEVTSRLTAIDNHPMNRVLGFGTKYLQENFSTWIQQHGGWDKAFGSDDDNDEVH